MVGEDITIQHEDNICKYGNRRRGRSQRQCKLRIIYWRWRTGN